MNTVAYLDVLERPAVERRRLNRVGVRLPGKFMGRDRKELPCDTIDISASGIALAAKETRELGESIVAYINPIGRVRGVVRRHFYGGFAMSMELPPLKRDKLANVLTWLAGRQKSQRPDFRLHARIRTRYPHTTLKLPSGRKFLAKIIDFSRADAALTLTALTAAAPAPEIGTTVTVGSKRAVVVRHFSGGVAIEFARMIPVQEFGEGFKL